MVSYDHFDIQKSIHRCRNAEAKQLMVVND